LVGSIENETGMPQTIGLPVTVEIRYELTIFKALPALFHVKYSRKFISKIKIGFDNFIYKNRQLASNLKANFLK
jgi:hypothetical protein